MIVTRENVPLAFIVLLVLSLPTSAQHSYKQLRPSGKYRNYSQKHVPVRITRLSPDRKLATVGDTIYALNARGRVIWKWSTQGAPLSDLPIVDSEGTIYAIGSDLVWVALDSNTGKLKWHGTGCGRAYYKQIGLYERDKYFVVTDMDGYRRSLRDRRIKDNLTICRGDLVLWEADIPIGSRIKIERHKLIVEQKRKGRTLRKILAVPHRFAKPIGRISNFGIL